MKLVKNFLNSITMYRLVLWFLVVMTLWSLIMAAFGFGAYKLEELGLALVSLIIVCYVVNWVLAKLWRIPRNVESAVITALILYFVMSPATSKEDFIVLIVSGVVAMASKYLLAWRGKHIFNPAAFAALFTGMFFSGLAIWWVGSPYFLPFSFLAAVLVFSKLRRWHMFWSFMIANLLTLLFYAIFEGLEVIPLFETTLKSWPLFFFAGVMLTEPLTTPPRKVNQIIYAVLVGVIAGWPFVVGPFYGSPELALLVGNLFSFALCFKKRLKLKLIERVKLTEEVHEMVFESSRDFNFKAGQYMEWTLDHKKIDNRGNRRFFTIASAPHDSKIRLGVKFYEPSSSFKKGLKKMELGDQLWAGQIDGDFVLPEKSERKLCFIAGGIGITPFVSHLRHMVEKEMKNNVVLLYGNRAYEHIAYKEFLEEAEKKLNFKVVHALSDDRKVPEGVEAEEGNIDKKMIEKYVKDCQDCIFYISGPTAMVDSFKEILKSLGVSERNIKSDYFPGFA